MKFLKLGRRATHILSIVAVAVLVTVKDRKFEDVRIALNAVAPTPIRAYVTESKLKGQLINVNVINDMVKHIAEEIKPISNVRASAEYRKEMSIVLTRDALIQALRGLGFEFKGWNT